MHITTAIITCDHGGHLETPQMCHTTEANKKETLRASHVTICIQKSSFTPFIL